MTDLRQAAQMALEALELVRVSGLRKPATHVESITALRAALAEPTYPLPDDLYPGSKDWVQGTYADRVAWLHTMYESAKSLHDALAEQLAEQVPVGWQGVDLDGMLEAFDRVIEAHYAKNHPFHNPINRDARTAFRILRGLVLSMQSHTAPQPAKRVQLTDEEIAALWLDSISGPLTATKFARAIERAHGINVPQARGEQE